MTLDLANFRIDLEDKNRFWTRVMVDLSDILDIIREDHQQLESTVADLKDRKTNKGSVATKDRNLPEKRTDGQEPPEIPSKKSK
jgi:hypothetical protein